MKSPTFFSIEPTRGLTDAQVIAVSRTRALIVTSLSGHAALTFDQLHGVVGGPPRILRSHLRILLRRDLIRGIERVRGRRRDVLYALYYLN